ncbi:MAG: 6,7-dimethyl-8-ribityllumazine synthase [Planctomycetota bacterium]
MARSSVSAELPPLAAATRVVALVSDYHSAVTQRMAASAQRSLVELGLAPDGWIEIAAPGAFELPLLAQRAARRPEVDAVLCFGLVLKGETPHDVYIAHALADGLMRVGLENDKPVLLGVLTTLDLQQAEHRAASRASGGLDKGHEVALACVAALHALDAIDELSFQ